MECKWYAVRTRSSCEERAADFFRDCGLETFIPSLHSKRSDNLVVPNMSSLDLIFVHSSAEELLSIKNSNRWPYFLTLYINRTRHHEKEWKRLLAITEKEMQDFRNKVDCYSSSIVSLVELYCKID